MAEKESELSELPASDSSHDRYAAAGPKRASLADIAKMRSIYISSFATMKALLGPSMAEGSEENTASESEAQPETSQNHQGSAAVSADGHGRRLSSESQDQARHMQAPSLPQMVRRVPSSEPSHGKAHAGPGEEPRVLVRGLLTSGTPRPEEPSDSECDVQPSLGTEGITIAGMAFGFGSEYEEGATVASKAQSCVRRSSSSSLNGQNTNIDAKHYRQWQMEEHLALENSHETTCIVHGSAFGVPQKDALNGGWGGLHSAFQDIIFDVFLSHEVPADESLLQKISSRKRCD